MNRRRFLKRSALWTTAIFVPSLLRATEYEKVLHLYHTHTGEHLKVTFWLDGGYVEDELAYLEFFLRDYRNDKTHPIDSRVIDYLYDISKIFGNKEIHILSGYRSPSTNEYLRRHTGGVAKRSFHLKGMAIDFRIPHVATYNIFRTALRLHKGGAGYYPKLGFIHIDSGRPRSWRYPKV